jgi:hypothetical protein
MVMVKWRLGTFMHELQKAAYRVIQALRPMSQDGLRTICEISEKGH